MTPGLREEVFRTETGLVGIVTLPECTNDRGLPAAVILNAGNLHRVGAGRASVTLAREMAGRGHLCLRFDHAGVGDSAPQRDGVGLEENRVLEISQVLSELEAQHGIDRFVLYGLCTGARDAFHAALHDERIVGIVQIDGFAYRNVRYYVNKVVRRIGDLPSMFRSLGRRLGLMERPPVVQPGEDMWVEEWSAYPPRSQVEAGYRELVARGVRMFVAFTGSWHEEYNYERQFIDMYPGVNFDDVLTLRYFPDAVHTLTDPLMQRMVVSDVMRWLDESFATDREPAS